MKANRGGSRISGRGGGGLITIYSQAGVDTGGGTARGSGGAL